MNQEIERILATFERMRDQTDTKARQRAYDYAHEALKKMMTAREEVAELRGAAKILDRLWTGSYYELGKATSDRIRVEWKSLFGDQWPETVDPFLKNGTYIVPLSELQAQSDTQEANDRTS